MSFKVCFAVLFPVCLVVACGCSGKTGSTPASLSGKVTYNGTPLKGGSITFHPKEGGVYPIALKEDGTYSISGLPVGEVTVTVDTEALNPDKPKAAYGGGRGGQQMMSPKPDNAPQGPKGEYVKIPSKYANPKQTDLKVNLNKGKNEQDFNLTD